MKFAIRKHLKGASYRDDDYIQIESLFSLKDTCMAIFNNDGYIATSAYRALNQSDIFENGLHQFTLVKNVRFSIDQLWSNTVEAAQEINIPETQYNGYLDLSDYRIYQKGVDYAISMSVISKIESQIV